MLKIRTIERGKVDDLLIQARAKGLNPGEFLDRGGFLLTQRRINEIHAKVIEDVAEVLATSRPSQFTKKTTQNDLQDAIVAYLRQMASEVRG